MTGQVPVEDYDHPVLDDWLIMTLDWELITEGAESRLSRPTLLFMSLVSEQVSHPCVMIDSILVWFLDRGRVNLT